MYILSMWKIREKNPGKNTLLYRLLAKPIYIGWSRVLRDIASPSVKASQGPVLKPVEWPGVAGRGQKFISESLS